MDISSGAGFNEYQEDSQALNAGFLQETLPVSPDIFPQGYDPLATSLDHGSIADADDFLNSLLESAGISGNPSAKGHETPQTNGSLPLSNNYVTAPTNTGISLSNNPLTTAANSIRNSCSEAHIQRNSKSFQNIFDRPSLLPTYEQTHPAHQIRHQIRHQIQPQIQHQIQPGQQSSNPLPHYQQQQQLLQARPLRHHSDSSLLSRLGTADLSQQHHQLSPRHAPSFLPPCNDLSAVNGSSTVPPPASVPLMSSPRLDQTNSSFNFPASLPKNTAVLGGEEKPEAAGVTINNPAGEPPSGQSQITSHKGDKTSDSESDLPLTQIKAQQRQTRPQRTAKAPTKAPTKSQSKAPTNPKKTRKKGKKDQEEPQKPVSAYALFFRDTQAVIKGQNASASFGEISKIVASMWESLDPSTKEGYKQRTELAKKDYLRKLAAYRANTSPTSPSSPPRAATAPQPTATTPSFSSTSSFSLPKVSSAPQPISTTISSSSFSLPTTSPPLYSSSSSSPSHLSSSSEVSTHLPPTPSSTLDGLDDFFNINPQSLIEQLLDADPLKPQRILVSPDSIKNVTDSLTEEDMAENNFLFSTDQQEQLLNQGYVVQSGGVSMNSVIQGGVIQQNPQNQFNGVVVNQVPQTQQMQPVQQFQQIQQMPQFQNAQQLQQAQQLQHGQQMQQVQPQPSVVVRNPNASAPSDVASSVPINLQSLQGLQTLKIAPGSKLQIHTNQGKVQYTISSCNTSLQGGKSVRLLQLVPTSTSGGQQPQQIQHTLQQQQVQQIQQQQHSLQQQSNQHHQPQAYHQQQQLQQQQLVQQQIHQQPQVQQPAIEQPVQREAPNPHATYTTITSEGQKSHVIRASSSVISAITSAAAAVGAKIDTSPKPQIRSQMVLPTFEQKQLQQQNHQLQQHQQYQLQQQQLQQQQLQQQFIQNQQQEQLRQQQLQQQLNQQQLQQAFAQQTQQQQLVHQIQVQPQTSQHQQLQLQGLQPMNVDSQMNGEKQQEEQQEQILFQPPPNSVAGETNKIQTEKEEQPKEKREKEQKPLDQGSEAMDAALSGSMKSYQRNDVAMKPPSNEFSFNDIQLTSEQEHMQRVQNQRQQLGLCWRSGCTNLAIESPGWDREYCSDKCCVTHCRDVFSAWVAARQANVA